jgi:hypothetical protein
MAPLTFDQTVAAQVFRDEDTIATGWVPIARACGPVGYFYALSPYVHDPTYADGDAARELLEEAFFGCRHVCWGWSW